MVEWVPNQFLLIAAARRGDYSDNSPRGRYFLCEGLLVNRILASADLTKPPLRPGELCDHRLRGVPGSTGPTTNLVNGFANQYSRNANPPPQDSLY